MPSNHLILCHPLLLPPSIFPSIRVFSNESVLHIRWPAYWSFSFSISPSNEYSRLISFKMDWLDLHAVQGPLKSLFQHHSSKASIFWHSAFFMVQLSHPYMTATSPSANQRSATSPSANQRIVHSLITNSMTRIPHPAFKGALLKPLGSSEVLRVEATHLLAWPCNKPFSAPNSNISLCLASLNIRHMNLH